MQYVSNLPIHQYANTKVQFNLTTYSRRHIIHWLDLGQFMGSISALFSAVQLDRGPTGG